MSSTEAAVRPADEKAAAPTSGRLSLRGLTKVYPGGVRAVDAIDLDIAPGEFVTLLGPSGCGKTTTLRMIAGFESPSDGEVELDGAGMIAVPPNKRPMAMVFQSYALFPHMSVRDNVAYGLKLRGTPAAQVTEDVDLALTSMNLLAMADRAPNQLSGGQQQRVALARAMVVRPNVLLFDEPLSNLDAKLRELMRLEIRRLQRRLGITSVYVTHDQAEAMAMSDRVIVMNNGRIEQAATPEEIYRRPASVFVADFIGRANFLPVTVLGVAHDGTARIELFGEEVVVPAHPRASGADDVVLLVRPESVRVRPSVAGEPGLERGDEELQGRRGRVLARVFYGDHVEYEIETEHGTVLAVESDPDLDRMPRDGELVEVSFAAERAWLLPQG